MSNFFRMRRLLQGSLLLVVVVAMLGAGDTEAKRFDRVGHDMMCACSCAQVLLECNHVGCPDSARMIGELHQQLDAGGSDKTILTWFAAKYGATVLASPIRGGFDDVAWIMPIALLLLGTVGTAGLIRVWKMRSPERFAPAAPARIPGMDKLSQDAMRERIRRETEY